MTIIETNSRKNFFSWFLYIIGTMTLLIVPINLISSDFRNHDQFVILLTSIIPTFIGILSLRILLWFIKGKEKVSVNNKYLIISKTGTFWITKEKRYELEKIKEIVVNKNFYEENSPSELVGAFSRWMYIFKIQNIGRIKLILSEYNSFKFLDNIEIYEAEEIIEKIKMAGNNASHNVDI
jgi:hypothetical protein